MSRVMLQPREERFAPLEALPTATTRRASVAVAAVEAAATVARQPPRAAAAAAVTFTASGCPQGRADHLNASAVAPAVAWRVSVVPGHAFCTTVINYGAGMRRSASRVCRKC